MSGPISKEFLKAVADVFDDAGAEAVRHVRDEDPETYAAAKSIQTGSLK